MMWARGIKFSVGSGPLFIDVFSAWNCWIADCEFSEMPSKTIMTGWSAHLELRHIYMHDQSNGGPDSEGLDLFCDTSYRLVVDNVCVAGGFTQINIGDDGPNPYVSGGFGNVIAYNYAVDAYYTDPPFDRPGQDDERREHEPQPSHTVQPGGG
jgi:hypothetical protein